MLNDVVPPKRTTHKKTASARRVPGSSPPQTLYTFKVLQLNVNLVIRLRILEQLAFFRVSRRCVELLAAMIGHSPILFVIYAAVSYEKPPSFSTLLERQIDITAT